MKKFWTTVVLAIFSSAALAQGILQDLGDKGTRTGYAAQTEKLEGGAQKVYAYDWVCPAPSTHPSNGQVTVPLTASECVSKTSNQVIQKRADALSSCYPLQFIGGEDTMGYQSTIQLGPRQCYDAGSRNIVAMVKQYRNAYYVAGGKAEDLEGGQSDKGGSGAGAAAAAAGAAAAGIFSGCTGNPFALCSGGRPGPKDPMRGCFDFLCPFGGL